MIKITAAMLMVIAPTLEKARAQELADLHNEICPQYGIDTPARYQAFIAQEAHESQEFTHKAENLNYSAERLLEVFPKYFNSDSAKICEHQPEKIGNMIYANRMGNGTWQSGDGYLFRGGGNIGLTGRDMYFRYAQYLKQDIKIVADLVRTTDRYALDSACWVFAIEKKLLDEADRSDIVTMREKINGGLIGLDKVRAYYKKCQAAIK